MSPTNTALGAAQVLHRISERLADPSAWTQGDFGRSLDGESRPSAAPDAGKWSLDGALLLEWVDIEAYMTAHAALCDTLGLTSCGMTLAGWNDFPGREHQEVLDVIAFTVTRLDAASHGAAA